MYVPQSSHLLSDESIASGDLGLTPESTPVAQASEPAAASGPAVPAAATTPDSSPPPTPVPDPVVVGPEPSKTNIYAHASWVGAAVLATAVAPFVPFLGAPEPITGVAVGLAISVLAALAKFL